MREPRLYEFKKREIFLIFLLLLVSGAIIFSLGIKIGQSLSSRNAPIAKEEIKLNNIYDTGSSYDDNKLEAAKQQEAKQEETKPEEIRTEEIKTEEIKQEIPVPTKFVIREITKDIKGKYTIQISSYETEDEARNVALSLYKTGHKLAYYMEAKVAGKGIWYRVGIGFFKQKASAETFADMLQKQGKISTYFIRRID